MAKQAVDRYVDLNGLRFHYRDWRGEGRDWRGSGRDRGGSGQPIVLLHGLASNSHIWDLVAPILSERFAVIALDQRSHGETEGTDDGYDFATIAGDLGLFLEALDIQRPLLAGHSWGGNVVLEHAVAQPDKTAGLIFVDGGFISLQSRDGVTWEEMAERMAPPDLTQYTIDQLVARSKENRWADMWRPEVEAVLRSSFATVEDGTIRPRLSRERHMKILRALWDHRATDSFSRVKAPVLILPARRDGEERPQNSNRPPKEETVAKAESLLSRSRTVWMEDSIHDVPLQRPDLVAGAIIQAAEDGFFDS